MILKRRDHHASDEQSESVVKRLVDALFLAMNSCDARAYGEPFAPDADFTNVFGIRQKGREAIVRCHVPIFETMFKNSRATATEVSVRFLRPDVAVADVRWEMVGARDPQGREWPLRRGLLILIATQEDGEWSIAVLHNMDFPPDDAIKAVERIQPEELRK